MLVPYQSEFLIQYSLSCHNYCSCVSSNLNDIYRVFAREIVDDNRVIKKYQHITEDRKNYVVTMVASTATDMTGPIYHERQVKELCALHALNNLFQERGFSKQELDQICYSLSPDVWINPHKSLLGLGNYDINVIMAALQRRGREAVWFDKRRDPKCLCLDNIEGFILNVPTEYKLGFVLLPLKRRHWIALKKIHGAFYNLDSKLDSPQLIGKDNDLLIYLKDQIDSKEKELFLVVSREIDSNQGWLIDTCENKDDNNMDHDSIRYIEDGYPDLDLKKSESKEMNENEKFLDNKNSR